MFLYEVHFVVDEWLRLAPSKDFYMRIGEEVAFLKATPQHGVRAVSYEGSLNVDMEARSDSDEAQYKFDIEKVASDSSKTSRIKQIRGSHLFTEFELYIYWSQALDTNKSSSDSMIDELLEYSSKWVRYFIELYGLFIGNWHISSFDAARMKFPAVTLFENGKITPNGVTGNRTTEVIFKPMSIMRELSGKLNTAPQETIQQIETRLVYGLPADLSLQLLLDARDQSVIFQRHDLSIVLTGTAFEVFLKRHLTTLCSSKNIKEFAVGKGKHKRKEQYGEYIEKANPMELLSVIQTVIGTQIKGTKYHSDWYSKAYNPRNDIVHRGVNALSAEDADKASEVVQKYRDYIASVS